MTYKIFSGELIDTIADNQTQGDNSTKVANTAYVDTGLSNKIDKNTPITGATKTKITYDVDGLITAGADATTADIADSTNKRYVSDAQLVVLGNTSGTNTGDQTSIAGIAGTKTQYNTSLSDGDFLFVGDITQYTDEMAQDAVGGMVDTSLVYNDATPSLSRAALTGAITAPAGSNTTSLGSFTIAQLNTAVSDADVAPTASPTFTGQVTINGSAQRDKHYTANSGSAYTIDPANGSCLSLTLNAANVALTLATNPISTTVQRIDVVIIQDGTGGRNITGWANGNFAAGFAPSIDPAPSAKTFITILGTNTDGWWVFGSYLPTNTITIGGLVVNGISSLLGGKKELVRVVTAAGTATLTSADNIVVINKTVGEATTVNLPAGVLNTIFTIKDGKGDAATNNITITPAAGNIDGGATLVLNTNFAFVTLIYDGSNWLIISKG